MTLAGHPGVSIVVPVLNERPFIDRFLSDVLAFETPPNVTFEVILLDGGSTDGTKERVLELQRTDKRLRVLDNPQRIQSTALNIAISQSNAEFILRLDAHSYYPRNYLQLCLSTAMKTRAHNIGGVVRTMARGEGFQPTLVQALTTHRFGVGDATFRVDLHEGEVDTVPYGFFRRTVFDKLGLFDERLVRAQDYEMNRRIKAAGGRIWMNPAITIDYHQQPTLFAFLRKQFLKEAPYNAYLWYCAPYAFRWRHAITGLFAAGVIIGAFGGVFFRNLLIVYMAVLALYAALALVSAAQQAKRYRDWRLAWALPGCFFVYHFLHGVGLIKGLSLLAVRRAPVQQSSEPWPGAGRRYGLPTQSVHLD